MEKREKIKRDKIRQFFYNRPATVRGPQESFPEHAIPSLPGLVRCPSPVLQKVSSWSLSVHPSTVCFRPACAPGVAPPDSELQLI